MSGDTIFNATIMGVLLALGLSKWVKQFAGSWEYLFTWLGIFTFLILIIWPTLAFLFTWAEERARTKRAERK